MKYSKAFTILFLSSFLATACNNQEVSTKSIVDLQETTNPIESQGNQGYWKLCKSDMNGYSFEYPANWKVGKNGGGGAVDGSCNTDRLFFVMADFYRPSENEIHILTQHWRGINTVDDYLRQPDPPNVLKRSTIAGAPLIWTRGQSSNEYILFTFHAGTEFDIFIDGVTQPIVDHFLKTFHFTP
jgi:hypothetical protein